jgi:hypothetical protein
MKQNPLSRRSFLSLAGGAGASLLTVGLVGVPAGAATKRGVLHLPTTGFSTSHVNGFSNQRITVGLRSGERVIHTKSMPAHPIDPDFSYPATPTVQNLTFRVSTTPRLANKITELVTGYTLGVHVDSVTLETASAAYYDNDFLGAWNYVPKPLDRYGAHTHPVGTDLDDGDYHYHQVTAQWSSNPKEHSPIVGWAADGFPVYLRYGYADPKSPGAVKNLASSFRIKSGSRPTGSGNPGGTYDGTYVADYEYVAAHGDLDQCNGRLCVTPEFPQGIYAYFLTDQWPSIPHWLRGTPDTTFTPQNNGSQGQPTGPPPGSGGNGGSGGPGGSGSNGGPPGP